LVLQCGQARISSSSGSTAIEFGNSYRSSFFDRR
jgi:hypothetical protein